MMVELTRALKKERLVRLGQVAKVTGLSVNYLAQLAIPLKNSGLLIGVSGKKGGYQLGRSAEEITISEILQALQGPVSLTDCVRRPDICLNSPFCEARMIWVIASHTMMKVLEETSLADLIDDKWKRRSRKKYEHVELLNPGSITVGRTMQPNCPTGEDE